LEDENMSLEHLALGTTNDFPIRTDDPVHIGKVRSVYWFTAKDSSRIIQAHQYNLDPNSPLGAMIISDRISAFDVNWKGEDGLQGVPGKGAVLNGTSYQWFQEFDAEGLAGNHVVAVPHPLVWIVQRAQPVMVEAIARQYITGSMWRAYDERGEREFCGIHLPNGLVKNQRLDELLITPTTKGIMRGIPGILEEDDTNITLDQISANYHAFGLKNELDVAEFVELLREGFEIISKKLESIGRIFVDTKFEFGYIPAGNGQNAMIYIDEVGTPDSSRIWLVVDYTANPGSPIDESKEGFRQYLIRNAGEALMTPHSGLTEVRGQVASFYNVDVAGLVGRGKRFKDTFDLGNDLMTNKKTFALREAMAGVYRVPVDQMMQVSATYRGFAEALGVQTPRIVDPHQEVLDALAPYGVLR